MLGVSSEQVKWKPEHKHHNNPWKLSPSLSPVSFPGLPLNKIRHFYLQPGKDFRGLVPPKPLSLPASPWGVRNFFLEEPMELKGSSTTSFDFQMEASGSRQIHHCSAQTGAAGAKGNECRPWIISHVWSAAPRINGCCVTPWDCCSPFQSAAKGQRQNSVLVFFSPPFSLSFLPSASFENPHCWELLHGVIPALTRSNSCPGSEEGLLLSINPNVN